jgi:hypothetical protein
MITGQKESKSEVAPSIQSKEEIVAGISNYQAEG